MKKALFLVSQPFFCWRGSPIRVKFDTLAITQSGYEVDLVVLPIGEDIKIPGLRIIRLPRLPWVKNVSIGPSLNKLIFDFFMLISGFSLCVKNKYDVIHCVEDCGLIGVFLASLFRKKLVFEKHSDPSSYKKGFLRNLIMRIYGAVEKFSCKKADAVIATGAGLCKQVEGYKTDKPIYHIFDIPSSLEEPNYHATSDIRRKLGVDDSEILAAYVGSFAVYQGVNLMFEAIPMALRMFPKLKFLIIGGNNIQKEEKRNFLRKNGCENAVILHDNIPPDKLPDYLAASDILLSPRLSGTNTPLKILDYMKVGKPILATQTDANKLILTKETALMVPPEPRSFAEGIVQLADNKILREMIGQKAKKKIAEGYNYKEFKKLINICYKDLFE